MRFLFGIAFLVLAALAAIALSHVPDFYRTGQMPLVPTLVLAEAVVGGLALFLYAAYSLLVRDWWQARRLGDLQARYASQPWLANADWAKGRVTYTAQGAALFLWFFTVNWWAVVIFMATDRYALIRQQSWLEQIGVLIFPLIGLGVLWAAISKTIDWWRYGRSVLTMTTVPGRPGRRFEATVRTRIPGKPAGAYKAKLVGFERETVEWQETDADGRRSSRRDTVDRAPFCETEIRIKPADMLLAGGGLSIPIVFNVPDDAPSSGGPSDNPQIIWRVELASTGRDDKSYGAAFDVPIFREA